MRERCVEVFGGANELIVDVTTGAAAAHGVQKTVDGLQIPGSECCGVAGEFSSVFKALETKCAGVAEFQLLIVEDLEHQHIVATLSERLQAARIQVLDMYSPIARRAGA